jgi:hypothetical protein
MPRINIKRRHTDKHPAIFTTENGIIRNKFVEFVGKRKSVSVYDFQAYARQVKMSLQLAHTPSKYFEKSRYFEKVNEEIRLTRYGRNLYNALFS